MKAKLEFQGEFHELSLEESKAIDGGWVKIALEIGAAVVGAGVYLYDNWECIKESYEENRK